MCAQIVGEALWCKFRNKCRYGKTIFHSLQARRMKGSRISTWLKGSNKPFRKSMHQQRAKYWSNLFCNQAYFKRRDEPDFASRKGLRGWWPRRSDGYWSSSYALYSVVDFHSSSTSLVCAANSYERIDSARVDKEDFGSALLFPRPHGVHQGSSRLRSKTPASYFRKVAKQPSQWLLKKFTP